MKARVNKQGDVILIPENGAEHFILHHTEFETVEEEYDATATDVVVDGIPESTVNQIRDYFKLWIDDGRTFR